MPRFLAQLIAHRVTVQGSLFGPYTPLQQLDILADFGTKSYVVGSTNSLLLQQKDRYSDILINLDEGTINITSTSLKAALQLSTPDRRWIDFITQNVNDTWDDADPSRPKTMGYVGSEEFIRVQFEEYLLSLISSVKYHSHLAKYADNPRMLLPDIEGDPSHDFGQDFVEAWSRTDNYRIWNTHTDSHLFDIVEPKHPCAGGLTIEDVQRRITQQVQDLHWDERFAQGKEVLGRNLAAGREKASTLFNKLYADMEALREAQRKRAEETRAQQASAGPQNEKGGAGGSGPQQTTQSVSSRAGAFVNSWAAWAGEKRRAAGWGRASGSADTNSSSGGGGGGWGGSWGRSSKNRASLISANWGSDTASEREPRMSTSSVVTRRTDDSDRPHEERPLNRDRGSVSGESMLDGTGSESAMSPLMSSRRERPLSGSSIAEVPVIDSVAFTGRRGGEENAAPNSNGTAATAEPKRSLDKEDAVEHNLIGKEEDDVETTPSPPRTPAPMSVATAEAVEAQEAWGKR